MDRESRKASAIITIICFAIGVILGLIEYFWFDSKILDVIASIILLLGFGNFLCYNILLPIFKD